MPSTSVVGCLLTSHWFKISSDAEQRVEASQFIRLDLAFSCIQITVMATKHGEADSYYNDPAGGQQMQYSTQTPPNTDQGEPQELQYQGPPPDYSQNSRTGPPPQSVMAAPGDGKQTFDQAFKVEKPKYNDLWAGTLVHLPHCKIPFTRVLMSG